MKKGLFLVSIVVMMVSVTLSGCQTNSVKTQKTPQNVFLDSTIVEFANVSYEKKVNRSGVIEAVVVGWMFHNIAGKTINVKINIKFYDKNNNFLYNESKNFYNFLADYTERYFSPVYNRVTYNGPGAQFVDHVVISVTEIT